MNGREKMIYGLKNPKRAKEYRFWLESLQEKGYENSRDGKKNDLSLYLLKYQSPKLNFTYPSSPLPENSCPHLMFEHRLQNSDSQQIRKRNK